MNQSITLIKETFLHWQKKRASRMGAAISFYAIFSIAPLFILLIGLVRTIFDHQTTQLAINNTLTVSVGSNLAMVIQNLINGAYHTDTGIITAIVSGVILIIAALSVFSELNTDLEDLWELPARRTKKETTWQTIRHYIAEKFVALGLIFLCAFLLLFSIAVTVFISFFHYELPTFFQHNVYIAQSISIILALIGSTILFTLIYRILPDTKLPWKELIWGAFITAILFLIGRFLVSWYISAFHETSSYGAAGSVVGLLLWIYYSAQVFFIGASGTFVYSKLHGHISNNR